MEAISLKAIDKLLFTDDGYTEKYRKESRLTFYENDSTNKISLPLAAYLEHRIKFKSGNIALGISNTPTFDILALEMDINEKDRVAVSISNLGAIYGLWFKKDNVYVNTSISVGASFKESIALTGLLLESALKLNKDANIQKMYADLEKKIADNVDITEELVTLTEALRQYSAKFVWLNNIGEISYRELYIHSLPYTSLVTEVFENGHMFLLFPVK